MRKLIFSSLLCGSIWASHDDWSLNNHWNFTADIVFLKRAELNGKTIVEDANKVSPCPCSNQGIFNTERLVQDFDFEKGWRGTLIFMMNKHNSFEASYLQMIDEWKERRAVHGHQNLSFPFNNRNYTNDFHFADKAVAEYESTFYTTEFNYWRHLTPRRVDYFSGSALIGARYFNLREEFELRFKKGSSKSNYDADTKNHLWGGQVGFNLQWNPTSHISWDLTAKVGGFYNRVKKESELRDNNNTTILRESDKHDHCGTFLAEVLATLTIPFGDYFNIHVGYEMIYLTGLALAAEQITRKDEPGSDNHINTKGEAIIHGMSGGVTLSF